MLVKRRLPLHAEVLHEPVLRREVIENFLLAEALLKQAQQQADELLLAAEYQCQRQLEQSNALFWERANRQLQALDDQSAALQCEALSSVERLLSVVLLRLLDDIDVTQRIRALMRNLSENQAARSAATLSCHPEHASVVRAWLSDSRLAALWVVQEDADVPVQALRLSHAQGGLDINWDELRRGLLGQPSEQVAKDGQSFNGTYPPSDATQEHFQQEGE